MENYKEVLAKQREIFITERSKQERDFSDFYYGVVEINKRHPGIFEGIPEILCKPEMSLQDFIPEIYKDDIDESVYEQQYEKLCTIIGRVQARVIRYNAEVSGVAECNVQLIDEANRKRREAFITERSRQELLVKAWNDKVQNSKSEKIKALGLPEKMSLEFFVPEYYKEVMNESIVHQQYQNMFAVIERVNAIVDEHLQEVEECLSEYRVLSSQKS